MDPVVMPYVERLFQFIPSPPVTGQIALELMVKPPQPGDLSYPLYVHVSPRQSKGSHEQIF